jgi:hypothetical protein
MQNLGGITMTRAQAALKPTAEVNKLGIKNKIVLPFTAMHLELAVAITRAFRFAKNKAGKFALAFEKKALELNRDLFDLVDSVLRFNKSYALNTIKIVHDRSNDMRNNVQRVELKNRSL